MPICGSPWLFAADRVLLRRLVPWHPPCALVRLILYELKDPETQFKHSGLISKLSCNWSLRLIFDFRLMCLSHVQLSRCMLYFCLCSCRPLPQPVNERRQYSVQYSVSTEKGIEKRDNSQFVFSIKSNEQIQRTSIDLG